MATKKTTKKPAKKVTVPAKEQPVLVTTAHRGVFFGYTDDPDAEVIPLKRARLCVRWSADVKGFMGLAANGPTSGCRIGPPADIKLRNITAMRCPDALDLVRRWNETTTPNEDPFRYLARWLD